MEEFLVSCFVLGSGPGKEEKWKTVSKIFEPRDSKIGLSVLSTDTQ